MKTTIVSHQSLNILFLMSIAIGVTSSVLAMEAEEHDEKMEIESESMRLHEKVRESEIKSGGIEERIIGYSVKYSHGDSLGPNTPLHEAAIKGDINKAKELLLNRVDINARNYFGDTPLHTAVTWRHIKMVTLLLAFGAKIDIQNCFGSTPFDIANSNINKKYSDHRDIKKLLEYASRINIPDDFRRVKYFCNSGVAFV